MQKVIVTAELGGQSSGGGKLEMSNQDSRGVSLKVYSNEPLLPEEMHGHTWHVAHIVVDADELIRFAEAVKAARR